MIYHSIAHIVKEKTSNNAFYFDARTYQLKEYPLKDLPDDRILVYRGIFIAMELPNETKELFFDE